MCFAVPEAVPADKASLRVHQPQKEAAMFKHCLARLRAVFTKTPKPPKAAAPAPIVLGPRVQIHLRKAARKTEQPRA